MGSVLGLKLSSAVILCLFVSSACACSCLPFTLKEKFESSFITKVVKAKLVYQVTTPGTCDGGGLPGAPCESSKIIYVFKQKRSYKGCEERTFFVAQTTPGSSCGTFLVTGTTYILALGDAAVPELGLCDYIIDVKNLRAEDKKTLRELDECSYEY